MSKKIWTVPIFLDNFVKKKLNIMSTKLWGEGGSNPCAKKFGPHLYFWTFSSKRGPKCPKNGGGGGVKGYLDNVQN